MSHPSLVVSRKCWNWEPPRERRGDVPARSTTWDGAQVGALQWAILCWLQVGGEPASTNEISEGCFVQWEDGHGPGYGPDNHVGYIDWTYGGVYQSCLKLEKRGFIRRVALDRPAARSEPCLKWRLLRLDPEIDAGLIPA